MEITIHLKIFQTKMKGPIRVQSKKTMEDGLRKNINVLLKQLKYMGKIGNLSKSLSKLGVDPK